MKKFGKSFLSIILVFTILFGAAPLSGFKGVGSSIWHGLCSLAVSAKDGSYNTNTVNTDAPTFEQYKSNILLGLKAGNLDNDSRAIKARNIFEYYLDENVFSPCKSFLDSCYEDESFMSTVDAWKTYSFFGAPSSAVDSVMKQEDYCMTLILDELNRSLQENTVLTYVKNKAVNNTDKIIKQLCKSMNIVRMGQENE